MISTTTDKHGSPASTLIPSIPFSYHLALTVTFITIFGLLFLFVYVQLWMILYYGHKRRSYQTVFLFLCLIWAALRVILFSFYFSQDSLGVVNALDPFSYWLLYSCPVVLQYMTLVLLVLFFSQVVLKARHPHQATKYKTRARLVCASSVIVFALVNMVCGILSKMDEAQDCSFRILVVRVSVDGALFVISGCALSYWIFSLNKIANARSLLESKGTNLCQSWLTCIFIVFIYASRVIYNVLALGFQQYMPNFGYGWINVTDQADLVNLYDGYNYVTYGVVLFIWEILPTFIVTVFFRVQKPTPVPVAFDDMSHRSYRQHNIFDNPGDYRYDEAISSSRNSSGSFNSNINSSMSSSYGKSAGPINASPGLQESNGRQGASYDPRHVYSPRSSSGDFYNGT